MSIQAINELSKRIKEYKVIIVSNREPYIHNYDKEEIFTVKPAGGVVTALDPLLQSDIEAVWVAWGSGSADAVVVDENSRVEVPPEDPKYSLKRVWLHQELINGYYYGFSNRCLWPLCHNSYVSPRFSENEWILYNHANDLFTKSVIEELDQSKKNIVFINDYHLSLVASNLRTYFKETKNNSENGLDENNDHLKLIMFWHIPWPPWEVFRILPWKKEILNSMLSLNELGLQTKNDQFNFLRTIQQEYDGFDIDFETGIITKPDGSKTLIKNFPISIDYLDFFDGANSKEVHNEAQEIKKKYKNMFIIVSVDRLDYIKGLVHRHKAIDRFFTRHPEYLEKVVFVQIISPSREQIVAYSNLAEEVNEYVEKINTKYQVINYKDEIDRDITCKQIDYLVETLSREALQSYYKAADAVLVSSIQDGMNLVVKEAIASGRDDLAVLVSKWAGSASQFTEGIRFNPYNINEFADSIQEVIELSKDDKKKRLTSMREKIKSYNIYDWIIDIFSSMLNFTDQ